MACDVILSSIGNHKPDIVGPPKLDHGPARPINIMLRIIKNLNNANVGHGTHRKTHPEKVNTIDKRVENAGPYISTIFAYGQVNNKNDIFAALVAHDTNEESIESPYASLNSLELGPKIIHVTFFFYDHCLFIWPNCRNALIVYGVVRSREF